MHFIFALLDEILVCIAYHWMFEMIYDVALYHALLECKANHLIFEVISDMMVCIVK